MPTVTYRLRNNGDFRVNTSTAGDQLLPAVTRAGVSGFAVAYNNGDANAGSILVDFYNDSGQWVRLTLPSDGNPGASAADAPAITRLTNGNIVVAWDDDGIGGLYATIYDSDGDVVRPMFELTPSSGDHVPQIAALAGGGFAAAYQFGSQIWYRIFAADGTPVTAEIILASPSDVDSHPAIVALADGGFVVTWERAGAEPQNHELIASVIEANGTLRAAVYVQNLWHNTDPAIAALPNGGFVVANVSNIYEAGAENDISVTFFSANGTWVRNVPVFFGADINESQPSITVLENGFIVVSYTYPTGTDDNVYFSVLDADGDILTIDGGTTFVFADTAQDEIHSFLAAIGSGLFLAVWQDAESDGSGGQISGVITELSRATLGDATNETLTGDALYDEIQALGGNDTLNGLGGNDVLVGGAGDDTVNGGDGDDVILINSGEYVSSEVMDGGAGTDTLRLANTAGGVFQVNTGLGTLSSIERLELLTLNSDGVWAVISASQIGSGFSSTAVINGSDGADQFDAVLSASGTVSLAGFQFTNWGVNDLISVYGTSGADTITGSSMLDRLFGNAGIDTLNGSGGNDVLVGGAGADAVNGGDGNDVILLESGDYVSGESLNGGAGSGDVLRLNNSAGGGVSQFNLGLGTITSFERLEMLTGNTDGVLAIINWSQIGAGLSSTAQIVGSAGADEFQVVINAGGTYSIAGFQFSSWGANDVISVQGSGVAEIITGTALADRLFGNAGNDTLIGSGGNDSLQGDAGTDVLLGGEGDDSLDGGADSDTANYSTAAAGVVVDLTLQGTAQNTVSAGSDTLIAIENLTGSAFNDTLTGDGANNTIEGAAGDDSLDGAAGALDVASYASAGGSLRVSLALQGAAQNTVGAGWDTLANFEGLLGSAFNDTLTGNDAANVLTGAGGADALDGGLGNDTLNGGDGNDLLIHQHSADTAGAFNGDAGFDTLRLLNTLVSVSEFNLTGFSLSSIERLELQSENGGGVRVIMPLATALALPEISGSAGDDEVVVNLSIAGTYSLASIQVTNWGPNDVLALTGTTGADVLTGTNGRDSILGGDNGDVLDGGLGDDTLNGGFGLDIATYASAAGGVTVNLALQGGAQNTGSAGADTLLGIEWLTGSAFNDTLTGDAGVNTLVGGLGADTLDGGAGNDSLSGGDGNDLLIHQHHTDTAGAFDGDAGTDTLRIINTQATLSQFAVTFSGIERLELQSDTGAGVRVVMSYTHFLPLQEIVGSVGDDEVILTLSINGTYSVPTITLTNWGANDMFGFIGTVGADTLNGSSARDSLNGGGGNDTIEGGLGNDVLQGGTGVDVINAGDGDDLLVWLRGDYFTNDQFNGGAGTDTLRIINDNAAPFSFNITVANTISSIERFEFVSTVGGNVILAMNANQIGAAVPSDALFIGSAGLDTLQILAGTSAPVVTGFQFSNWSATDTVLIAATTGNDVITGTSVRDSIDGSAGNDVLYGGDGNDTLDGNNGNDIIDGGAGNDVMDGDSLLDTVTYASATAGVVVSLALQGAAQNTVGAGSDTLTAFENLTGSSFNDQLFGDGNVNTLVGGDGDDILTGGTGADVLTGGNGFDAANYGGSAAGVTVNLQTNTGVGGEAQGDTFSSIERIFGSAFNDVLTGTDLLAISLLGANGNDTLQGGAENDTLDGGAGADTMTGGNGNDTYVVDDAGDVTTETSALGGVDTVQSSLTRTLGANLENLVLTGAAAVSGFGNALNNAITGNSAANQLNGFDGNDVLDGGAGADSMFGGNGDDSYYVDNSGDLTTETSALGGIDIVYSSVARNLTANIENLTLTGAAAVSGSGNALNNLIIGNTGANTLYGFDGNDRLDGGAGADTLFGAAGDDVYVVDNVGDITVEGLSGAAGGIDTVETYISRNMNANFENMILMGSATIAYGNVLGNVLTGNALANALYGFDGNDTLDGGAGVDSMFGANGDDTYIVDNAGDVTSEVSALGGIDTVISSVERNLTANLENLTLSGGASINGAGNGLNNVITGNSGVNTLFGLGGDDTLNGGLGADSLQGGAGADTYAFSTALGGGNVDAIVGFSVADDTIYLNNAVFTGLATGALAAGAFVVGAAAADADDRIIYNSATGQLYFDADGNGGGAAVLFATLSAGLSLTSADFIVGGP